jgi:O-acetyl-ADP-ribose deacetylase
MDSDMRIEIVMGDITDMDVDAVVNAANTHLVLGSGVAGAIRKKGGPEIQYECDNLGHIPLGEAAVTTGGALKARYVIHAAGMHPGGSVGRDSLIDTTVNSLRRADENHLRTIAFPAIGTGVGGFPLDECAELMIGIVSDYLQEGNTAIEKVFFVLFDDTAYVAFVEALNRNPAVK